jgi:phage/plasmid-like protein (TIGR03299 family)
MTDTTASQDVNTQFDLNRQAQIQGLMDARNDYQARVAEFESGEAQAKLDAQLADRVASGTIRMIGTDRYEVLQGWDRGEIFNVRKAARPGELTLIEPESGLDEVDGIAQGFFDRPEWHRLGNVKVGGSSDIEEVLTLGGLNYQVLQRPVRYYDDTGQLRIMPGSYVNYRDDTGDGLGVVGKIYTPFQNEVGAAFLQELVADADAKFASAFPLDNGGRAVITMELPEAITIDAEGVNDKIDLYLAWLNNHTGQGKAETIVTPWRMRCGNTERLGVQGALTRWGTRHTTNGLERLEEARRNLGMTLTYAEKFTAEQERLAHSAATMDDILLVMDEIWQAPKDGPEQSRKWEISKARREDQLAEGWAKFGTELGRTKYAAERVFTDWFDHVAPRRTVNGDSLAAARATAALVGADDKNKTKAHKLLLATCAK